MSKTSQERRATVAAKYATIIGRNRYNQDLRDYCYRKYKDGNYYSDCSSSICHTYQEAGEGFGNLNTAGIYRSAKLTTVNVPITDGIPDAAGLRVGDMLEFAGTDASRPKRIGHVEMVHSIDGSKAILCGHGSGRPSYKDMAAYCRSCYASYAPGGWRKGLVCVRRYIQDDTAPVIPDKPSGWRQEADGRRFYLGNTGDCVCNAWYQDADGRWYWFDGAGRMLHDTWYQYQGFWYYLGTDGAMVTGQPAYLCNTKCLSLCRFARRRWYCFQQCQRFFCSAVSGVSINSSTAASVIRTSSLYNFTLKTSFAILISCFAIL